jgi:SPP1 gp7 family putative phage head morphogenesis protein
MEQSFKLRQALRRKRRLPAPKNINITRPLEKSYSKDLEEIFKFLLVEIQKKLLPYLPYASSIITKKVPEIKMDDGSTLLDGVDDDISRIVRAIRENSLKRFSPEELARMAKKRGISLEKMTREAFERDLKRVVGVDLLTADPAMELQIGMFAQENVSLITSLMNDSISKVENKIFQGFRSGLRWEEIAADITRFVDPVKGPQVNRARFIARDQISKLNGQLTQTRQRGLGISRYIWATSNDERVRDSHRDKEGKIYSWDDPPADTGHPGEDFQCRCTAIPYLADLID